jgi:hypothetical protein
MPRFFQNTAVQSVQLEAAATPQAPAGLLSRGRAHVAILTGKPTDIIQGQLRQTKN